MNNNPNQPVNTPEAVPVQQPAQPAQQVQYSAPVQQPAQQVQYAAPVQQPAQQVQYAAPVQQPAQQVQYAAPVQYAVPVQQPAQKNKSVAKIIVPIAIVAALLIIGGIVAFFSLIYAEGVVVPANKYSQAVELFENGSYEEASAIFEELGDYEDSVAYKEKADEEIEKAELYDYAMERLEAGDIETAFTTFYELSGYKDADDWLVAIYSEYYSIKGQLKHASVGDDICLVVGYDSPLWRVVAKKGDKVLLAQRFTSDGFEPNTITKNAIKGYMYSYDFDATLEAVRDIVDPEIQDSVISAFLPDEALYKTYIKDSAYTSGDNYPTVMFIGEGPGWNIYREDKSTESFYNLGYYGTDMKKNGECPSKEIAYRIFIWVDISD